MASPDSEPALLLQLRALDPGGFEALACELFTWEHRGRGQLRPNPTPHGVNDGGADWIYEGEFAGQVGRWWFDAKMATNLRQLKESIRRRAKRTKGEALVFVTSLQLDDAKQIDALLRWAQESANARVILGKSVVQWARRWRFVAGRFLKGVDDDRTCTTAAKDSGFPFAPTGLFERIVASLQTVREVHVIGGHGLGLHHVATDLAAHLNAEGGVGAVLVASEDAGRAAAALERLPPGPFAIVVPPGRGAVPILEQLRGDRPAAPRVIFVSPDEAHALAVSAGPPFEQISAELVPAEVMERWLAHAKPDLAPERQILLAAAAAGQPGYLAAWLRWTHPEEAARGAAATFSEPDSREEAEALLLLLLSVPVATTASIERETGVTHPQMRRLLDDAVSAGILRDGGRGIEVESEAGHALALTTLLRPTNRPVARRWCSRADSSDVAVIRYAWHTSDWAPLQARAQLVVKDPLQRLRSFADLAAGLDETVDRILVDSMESLPEAPGAPFPCDVDALARLGHHAGNVTRAVALASRRAARLPSGEVERLARALVDPEQPVEEIFIALRAGLGAEPTHPTLATACAKIWLRQGIEWSASTREAVHWGARGWNESSPRVSRVRETVFALVRALVGSADRRHQLAGWDCVRGTWFWVAPLEAEPAPPSILSFANEMLAEAARRFRHDDDWEVRLAAEQAVEQLWRNVGPLTGLPDCLRSFRRDPDWMLWRELVDWGEPLRDPVAAASKVASGPDQNDQTDEDHEEVASSRIGQAMADAHWSDAQILALLERVAAAFRAGRRGWRMGALEAWIQKDTARFKSLFETRWTQIPDETRALLIAAAAPVLGDWFRDRLTGAVDGRALGLFLQLGRVVQRPEREPAEEVIQLARVAFWQVLAPRDRASFLFRLAAHEDERVREDAADLLTALVADERLPLAPTDVPPIVARLLAHDQAERVAVVLWARLERRGLDRLGPARASVVHHLFGWLVAEAGRRGGGRFWREQTLSAAALASDPDRWVEAILTVAVEAWLELRPRLDPALSPQAARALRVLALRSDRTSGSFEAGLLVRRLCDCLVEADRHDPDVEAALHRLGVVGEAG